VLSKKLQTRLGLEGKGLRKMLRAGREMERGLETL